MNEKHVHYWIIDSENIGRCSCGAVKDFGKLLRKELSTKEKQPPDAVGLFPRKKRSHRMGRPPKYA